METSAQVISDISSKEKHGSDLTHVSSGVSAGSQTVLRFTESDISSEIA